MKINRNVQIVLIILALTVTGIFGTSQQASAKTKWSRYIPTTLRGNWKSKKGDLPDSSLQGQKGYMWVSLKKDYFSDINNSAGGNFFAQKKMYYHHKSGSNFYYVKGTAFKGLSRYTEFHKVGNKLQARLYGENDSGKYTKYSNPWSLWMYKK